MQAERRGMENIAKFLNSQESFNFKMGLVPSLCKSMETPNFLKILLSVYIAHKEWEYFLLGI